MHIPEGKQGKAGALSLDTFWPGYGVSPLSPWYTQTGPAAAA